MSIDNLILNNSVIHLVCEMVANCWSEMYITHGAWSVHGELTAEYRTPVVYKDGCPTPVAEVSVYISVKSVPRDRAPNR